MTQRLYRHDTYEWVTSDSRHDRPSFPTTWWDDVHKSKLFLQRRHAWSINGVLFDSVHEIINLTARHNHKTSVVLALYLSSRSHSRSKDTNRHASFFYVTSHRWSVIHDANLQNDAENQMSRSVQWMIIQGPSDFVLTSMCSVRLLENFAWCFKKCKNISLKTYY